MDSESNTPASARLADGQRPARLTDCLRGWPRRENAPLIGVLDGEGVGPEVVDAALVVLDAVVARSGSPLEVRRGPRMQASAPIDFADSILAGGGALFCGPIGGRAVYELRAHFDLFCKLVPLRPCPALADATILRPERLSGVDVLVVRENIGGLYMGEFGRRDGGRLAYQSFTYTVEQVERIVEVAARLAVTRQGRLATVVKAGGIPEISTLWQQVTEQIAGDLGLTLEILEIDNACFQLVADAGRFDVLVAPNLFGDVLADGAAVLLGSRGMSYSGNFGWDGRAAYQTGHGAAHDIAGLDRANPVAQILALSMLLRESQGMESEAGWIETAVECVLGRGVRTADVAGPSSRVVGTAELAELIAAEISQQAGRERRIG